MIQPDNSILFASAKASVSFALACLEPFGQRLRLKSSFVTPDLETMPWHEFGDLEGPGWGTNTLGGAHLLYRWGAFTGEAHIQEQALQLLDHILEDGFIDESTGFIYPYYDLGQGRFCLNYTHGDQWLCPGSLARIGCQMLDFAADLPGDQRSGRMQQVARALATWLARHVRLLASGWAPRRVTPAGEPFPLNPSGGLDSIFEASADGLYLLQLYARLSALARPGDPDFAGMACQLGDCFVASGGFYGSINHDTYDLHESVAYATAFRVLRETGKVLGKPEWTAFAYSSALPGLEHFILHEDRHGLPTRGLLWMENTWNTAYLWENAEAALAFLEAWEDGGHEAHLAQALGTLEAIARHHHGASGFLTEGVDWDNQVSSRHHLQGKLYEDIRYTEPLLNNLHLLAPSLAWFRHSAFEPPAGMETAACIEAVRRASHAARLPQAGAEGVRYLLRLFYPALENEDRLAQSLDFTRRSGVDGVLLFESSYDMDPALLTQEVLSQRFARLKSLVPRFRALVATVHINVMITLGHVDAGSARPERFPFQFMVDETGQVSRSSACPLDPAFLAHVAKIYQMAAACQTDAVWVDDDTRFLWHDLSEHTCFCPRHLAAMQARTGRPWTRPELVQALRDDSLDPTLRHIWFDLQEQAILDLAHTVERAVHAIDPRQAIGLMSVGQAIHAAEGRRSDRLLRALAGAESPGSPRPLFRPGSGFWTDERPLGALDKAEGCRRELALVGADVQAVAEIENHPYTPFGKSERVLALEMALDVLNGMPDLSLNILSSMSGSGPLEPEGCDAAAFLQGQRPWLDALAMACAGKRRLGIGIGDAVDYARHARLRGKPLNGWIQARPWESILARLGFPLGQCDSAPHWLAGDVLRSLSDYELAWQLREGAVLDAQAAQALIERGWGANLGLNAVLPLGDGANELLVGDPLTGAYAGQVLPVYNHIPFQRLYTWDFAPGRARVLSQWLDVDGNLRGPALALLEAPGQVFSANLPWRVALLPFTIEASPLALLNLPRRHLWAGMLETVAGKKLPLRVTRGVNLVPYALAGEPGEGWLVGLANLSADDAPRAQIELHLPLRGDWRIETLQHNGHWQPTERPTASHLEVPVPAYSLAAVRLTPQ